MGIVQTSQEARYQSSQRVSIASALDQFLHLKEQEGVSPKTVRGYYQVQLPAFVRWTTEQGVDDIADVTPQLVADYLRDLREGRYADASLHTAYRALKTFLRWSYDRGYLKADPLKGIIRPPRIAQHRIPVATEGDVARLIQMARRDASKGGAEGYRAARDYAIIALTFDTGLRLSEVAGIRLGDIDWRQQAVRVLGKGQKERVVYFGDELRRVLATFLRARERVAREGDADPGAPLFLTVDGRPLSAASIATSFKRLRRRVGVRAKFHGLRHAFAAAWLRAGGDPFSLQEQLGHSSLDMVRVYLRAFGAERATKARRFSPFSRLGRG